VVRNQDSSAGAVVHNPDSSDEASTTVDVESGGASFSTSRDTAASASANAWSDYNACPSASANAWYNPGGWVRPCGAGKSSGGKGKVATVAGTVMCNPYLHHLNRGHEAPAPYHVAGVQLAVAVEEVEDVVAEPAALVPVFQGAEVPVEAPLEIDAAALALPHPWDVGVVWA
jgi:hypothetical protein